MMIATIKLYGTLCFGVCILFIAEHIYEFYTGKATSTGLLTFLTLLFGTGGGFLFTYAKYLVDADNDGISDEVKKGGNNANTGFIR